jgi:hypothetical protein
MPHGTQCRSRKAEGLSVASGCLYVVSFLLPVGWGLGFFGLHAFVCSAMIPFVWPMWAANPVLWFGLVKAANQRWEAARNAGVLAMLLAISEAWMFLPGLGVGYFCWLCSMIALATAGAYGAEQERRSARTAEGDETAIQVLLDRPAVRVARDTNFLRLLTPTPPASTHCVASIPRR